MSRFIYTSLFLISAVGCGDNHQVAVDGPPMQVECRTTSDPPLIFGVSLAITGNGATWASPQDEPPLLEKIINDGCGLIGDEQGGKPVHFVVLDSQDSQLVAPGNIDQLAAQGAIALSGAGAVITTQAALVEDLVMGNGGVGWGLPFLNAQTSGANLTYCTEAQLADPNVTKSAVPTTTPGQCFDSKGLVFRMREVSAQFAAGTAAYVQQIAPAPTQIAIYNRTEPSGSYEIGFYLKPDLEALGHTVNWVLHPAGTPTVDQFKTTIIPAMLQNNPTIALAGAATPQLANWIEGWAQYAADPNTVKPSNFNNIKLIFFGNVAGSDFTALSLAARTLMQTRLDSVQQYWDESREGFKRWYSIWTDFYPNKTTADIISPMQHMFFDGWMIMALSVIKAGSTSPDAIKAAYKFIANPPGTVYYPDQFKEARAALMRGEDIDFQGSLIDGLTENLEASSPTPYAAYKYDLNGVTTLDVIVQ